MNQEVVQIGDVGGDVGATPQLFTAQEATETLNPPIVEEGGATILAGTTAIGEDGKGTLPRGARRAICMSTPRDILTIAEVARELRCSKAHLSNLLAGRVAGVPALPHVPLGRRKLIRRAALEHWIRSVETRVQQ
jgi:hypothetical protein